MLFDHFGALFRFWATKVSKFDRFYKGFRNAFLQGGASRRPVQYYRPSSKYYRPRNQYRPVLGRGRDGGQFSETKYYRPWTIILSSWTRTGRRSNLRNKISSSLDDNVIVLGRGRDGNVLALDDNIIVLGR